MLEFMCTTEAIAIDNHGHDMDSYTQKRTYILLSKDWTARARQSKWSVYRRAWLVERRAAERATDPLFCIV